ncbi:hypothetical protein F5B20DRAFT_584609 [Whalleya microplaca]|nr:hypothetical protein F5B20DRAFT_584609 [Whalleya microplaca]
MRLLNVKTRELEEFSLGRAYPMYAILSHTWGEDEVQFRDLRDPDHRSKPGYAKIEGTCRQAAKDNFGYVWIDTCCIDKSSSAELSEASTESEVIERAFRTSRWFTRGWTLQELLAPNSLVFFTSSWTDIFHWDPYKAYSSQTGKANDEQPYLHTLIKHITGIDLKDWHRADVAERLSWASRRTTTKEEDLAYCLLGLLEVNMPLLYGEGKAAFYRLLKKVIKKSNYHGVLTAGYQRLPFDDGLLDDDRSFLPESPGKYIGCAPGFYEVPIPGIPNSAHFSMTNAGLLIDLPLMKIDPQLDIVLALLSCQPKEDNGFCIAIPLDCTSPTNHDQRYSRISGAQPLKVPLDFHRYSEKRTIYLNKEFDFERSDMLLLGFQSLVSLGYRISGLYPPCQLFSIYKQYFMMRMSPHVHDWLILLLAGSSDSRNIAVKFNLNLGTTMIALTDADSIIELLLKCPPGLEENGSSPEILPSWYTEVSFDRLEKEIDWVPFIHLPMLPTSDGISNGVYAMTANIFRGQDSPVKLRLDINCKPLKTQSLDVNGSVSSSQAAML